MKAKFLLAAICIFSLPLWSSTAFGNKPTNPAPYAAIAYAGHTLPDSSYCDCNDPSSHSAMPQQLGDPTSATPGQDTQGNTDNAPASEAGLGSLALSMLLLWLQLKS